MFPNTESSVYPLAGPVSSDGGTVKLEELVTAHFEQLRGSVYNYLFAVFGNAADAEEATQEAFLRLYRALHAGHTIRNVRSWVLRVAHNVSIERYKQRERDQILNLATADADALSQLLSDPALDPEERVLQQERWIRLNAAWMSLTPQQKQCLRLRVEGLRYREIAKILGVSISTVADLLDRSIVKLMKKAHE
jgi:RNA polymerase sigma-70 factor, ECF subfamily